MMDLRSPATSEAESPESGHALNNADAPWDSFDSVAYVDSNYRFLRADDEEILRIVRDHFSDHFDGDFDGTAADSDRVPHPVLGIDVGAGANLYPALSMLPWCDGITLFERSAANVGYLERQRAAYDPNWDQFWDVLREREAYGELSNPRARFGTTVRVEPGDLFDLDLHRGRWSLGTMFFVAESMSTSHKEFETGVERFMRALAPGAPFAAAFMEGSLGYKVGGQFFPACSVTETEVLAAMSPYADGPISITPIGKPPEGGLRSGYEGMIVACGRRNSE
jgi:hypothetical protein